MEQKQTALAVIIENESYAEKAIEQYPDSDIFLLNKTNSETLSEKVINYEEISQSFAADSEKFPMLLTLINAKYSELQQEWDYIILTNSKENFTAKIYVADFDKIKVEIK